MRIERLRQAFHIDVRFVHFPLHPETPAAGQTLAQLFAGRSFDIEAAQVRMRMLMAAEGLPYGDRTMTYNSGLAQELATWAVGRDGGDRIHDALFRAYFVDNVNIADVDRLVDVGTRVGLPAVECREVLHTRRRRPAVRADWERSRALGVTGVPTFVAGGGGEVVGAQPYAVLEALVRQAGARAR